MSLDTGMPYTVKCIEETFSDEQLKNSDIVIYSFRCACKVLLSYFSTKNINVEAVVDNRDSRIGQVFCGVKVVHPKDVLSTHNDNRIVIIATEDEQAVRDELCAIDPAINDQIYFFDFYNYDPFPNTVSIPANAEAIDLKGIQLALTDALRWFDDFCNKNNLRYFVCYGTLLGTIRHKGFIPWDDDIDVSMPAKDYIKCVELLSKQDEYLVDSPYCYDDEMKGFSTLTKLRLKNYVTESRNFPLRVMANVAFDIWPISGFEGSREDVIKTTAEWEELGDYWKRDVVIPYGSQFFDINRQKELISQMTDNMNRYDYDTSSQVLLCYAGKLPAMWSYLRATDSSNYKEILRMPFDDFYVNVPCGYDKILTETYGDYMTPPPDAGKAARHTKAIYRIC